MQAKQPAKPISPEELRRLRREFLKEAEQAFEGMFGSDGRNGLVTFSEREDRACQMGDQLMRWLLEQHLGEDEAADPGEEVLCPLCGGEVTCAHPERQEMQKRELLTRRGKAAFERAARRCSRCRRIFFPAG